MGAAVSVYGDLQGIVAKSLQQVEGLLELIAPSADIGEK